MIRSKKKGFYINYFLLKDIYFNKDKKKLLKTSSRSSIIIPQMVGSSIGIHNGRIFIPIIINNLLIGYKLGEFSLTRLFKSHKKIVCVKLFYNVSNMNCKA